MQASRLSFPWSRALFHHERAPSHSTLELKLDGHQSWAGIIQDFIEQRCADEPLPPSLESSISSGEGAGLPFSGLLQPFLRIGATRLRKGLAEQRARHRLEQEFWSSGVVDALLTVLAERLQSLASRTLVLELHVARLRGRLRGQTPQERFHYFSTTWLQNAQVLESLLQEYPVLARLMASATEHWVVTSLELLDRLAADRELISQAFHEGLDIGLLTEVQCGISDPHRQGRSVAMLHFSSGLQLMYKPRSLAVDARFQELLQWLNAEGLRHAHRVLKVVDRGSHGWVEYVAASGCGTREALQRFYWRQGSTLTLLHLLTAVDFHLENLIAAGEYPVLVDLEALLHHRQSRPQLATAHAHALDVLARSVCSVGLLPRLFFGRAGYAGVDVSGLGGEPGQLAPITVPTVEDMSQDTMRVVRRQGRIPEASNRPRLQDQPVDPTEFTEDIIQGFQDTWLFLARRREALIPRLHTFADVEVRHLVRTTQRYVLLLQESHHPDYLRNGLGRDEALDHLWLETDSWPALRTLVPFEHADLLQGDIPSFTARPGQRHLWSSTGECIPGFFEQSSLEEALERLGRLDDTQECARQVSFIRQSMAIIARGPSLASQARQREQPPPVSAAATPEECLAMATTLGEELAGKVVRGRTDACWLGMQVEDFKTWRLGLTALGPDLYEGVGGMTLFFAWLAVQTGRSDFEEIARMAMKPVLQAWRDPGSALRGVGPFPGRVSAAYLLAHLSTLWKEPNLLEDVLAELPLLEPLIDGDRNLDLISGTAGYALLLLGLYERTGDPRLLAVARRCGEHLLTTAVPAGPEGGVGWKSSVWEIPLAGFAHGNAGIAYTLLALATATGDARYEAMARQALIYERSLFVPERGNWQDLRHIAGPNTEAGGFMTAWCYGAPGIALGRMLSLRYLDDAQIRAEIETALETTLRDGFGDNHSLCHGDLGNLEVLHMAGKLLDEPRWTQAALERAVLVIHQGREHSWRCGLPRGTETPGLMTGLAGIGYGLLRLAAPTQVPSVLALALP